MSALAGFPYLQDVNVSGNRLIKSIDCVRDLVHLSVLDASNNRIGTFPELHARALAELKLAHNLIQDIGKSIAHHQFLRVLEMSNNQLTSLKDLHGLKNLNYLDVSNNAILSLEGIENLPISELYIANNALQTLENSPELPFLRFLDVSSNMITELYGLAHYQKLTVLHATDNHIASLQSLHLLDSLTMLRELNLDNNSVQKIQHYRLEVFFV